jgi:hypothetical protein
MKVKLTRCHICHNWYSPEAREHCNGCGAIRVYLRQGVANVLRHYHCLSGREMRSGFIHYKFRAHALEIAQVLWAGDKK